MLPGVPLLGSPGRSEHEAFVTVFGRTFDFVLRILLTASRYTGLGCSDSMTLMDGRICERSSVPEKKAACSGHSLRPINGSASSRPEIPQIKQPSGIQVEKYSALWQWPTLIWYELAAGESG